MPRYRTMRPVAFHSLLAAICLVAQGGAFAQSAYDLLSPDSLADQDQLPRFQQRQAQYAPPVGFTPPASGAGNTGFDSTNSRKLPAKRAPKPKAAVSAEPIAPGEPQPLLPSPDQQPPPPLPATGAGAYAQAPGTPPVELGPIRRPKKRKTDSGADDPYAPLGVDAGGFTLFPSVDLIGGYNSNPGQTEGGRGAALYTVEPELQAQSNWSRHELKADLRGSYTGYSPDQVPSLNRPYFEGKVDGRIDVTHQSEIDLGLRDLVSTDNPGSPNLQAGLAKLPVFTTFGGSAAFAQRFNRLEIKVKGDVERTVYENSTLTDGTIASNADRQYDQYTGALRGSYELSPGVKPFVEVSADTRIHDLETDFSGYQRDSNGITEKAGSTFKLTHTLTGEIAVGYVHRTYEDARLPDIDGLIGDASLIWTASALTTAKLSASSTVGESTIPGVSGVLYRDVGLQVDHAFRQWLIGTAKIGFGLDDYVGLDRLDRRYSAGVGLTYKFSRTLQLKSELRQDWLHSNVAGNNYNATTILLGLRVQR